MDVMERAGRAQELLDNRTFKEVHAEIRNELIAALETVGMDDVEKQHELVLVLQLHNRQRKKLEQWIADGKMEQKRLDHRNWVERARQRFVG